MIPQKKKSLETFISLAVWTDAVETFNVNWPMTRLKNEWTFSKTYYCQTRAVWTEVHVEFWGRVALSASPKYQLRPLCSTSVSSIWRFATKTNRQYIFSGYILKNKRFEYVISLNYYFKLEIWKFCWLNLVCFCLKMFPNSCVWNIVNKPTNFNMSIKNIILLQKVSIDSSLKNYFP